MKALLVLMLAACGVGSAAARTIAHGRFESVHIQAPPQRAEQVVILFADQPNEGASLARTLAMHGALVATIDTRALFADLERDDDECVSPNGDLENLSHYVQAMQHLDNYHAPILVGVGVGAPFVYAMLAQSPSDTFAGGLSLRFCPELALRKPLCESYHLKYAGSGARSVLETARLERPWSVLNASNSACATAARAFASKTGVQIESVDGTTLLARAEQAYEKLASGTKALASSKRPLPDLPLVEVTSAVPGDAFGVMLSGDGGWAGLDKEVAQTIAKAGIPIVGLDSLRYFWTKRSPEELARDLDRIVRTYAQRWHRTRVVAIGYSHGADVLPFAINRADAATRSMLSNVVLIGLAERASFEFHVGSWIGLDGRENIETAPEMQRMHAGVVTCIYGSDDTESTCKAYTNTRVRAMKLPGGHHFNGDYAGLARTILHEVKAPKPD